MDFAEIVLSLYWVRASRCLVTVLNPVSIVLRTPYWFSHWRLDFDIRLVKNVMRALAKPVWPEWLAQKLGLRRLKTFTRFLQSISCSPSGERICMQGALSYDLNLLFRTYTLHLRTGPSGRPALTNGKHPKPQQWTFMNASWIHAYRWVFAYMQLWICSGNICKNEEHNELSTFDLDVFPSHIHKLPAAKPVGRIVSIFHHTSKSPFSCSSKVSLQCKRNLASTPVGLFFAASYSQPKTLRSSFWELQNKEAFLGTSLIVKLRAIPLNLEFSI